MPHAPKLRTPLGDITGSLVKMQDTRCGTLEMMVINCFEAYGHMRALKQCKDIMDDFKECYTKKKQRKRISEIRAERLRQISSGELPPDQSYGEGPTIDSFCGF